MAAVKMPGNFLKYSLSDLQTFIGGECGGYDRSIARFPLDP